jgi:hypothetical protein
MLILTFVVFLRATLLDPSYKPPMILPKRTSSLLRRNDAARSQDETLEQLRIVSGGNPTLVSDPVGLN